MKPAKKSPPFLGGLFQKEVGPFALIMGFEVAAAIAGLYILVFQASNLTTFSYIVTALVLAALYEHGRGLYRKRKWAFAICGIYGLLVMACCALAGILFLLKGSSSIWERIFQVSQCGLYASGGLSLIKKSYAAMKEPERAGTLALVQEKAPALDGWSATKEQRYDREDDESDEQYLSDTRG